MNKNSPIPNKSLLRESIEVYRWGRHCLPDLITSLTREEAQQLLRDLVTSAPNSLAKAAALRYPYTADQADQTEGRIQEMLPLHWKRSHADSMNDAWQAIRPGRPS